MKISGNTIVITGGTSGIGLALAIRFTKEGNKVIICGRRYERLAEIKKAHPAIETRVCDITNHKQRVDFAKAVQNSYPDINVLVNNAGVQMNTSISAEIDMKNVHDEIETNLTALIHFTALFGDAIATHADAALINVSSGLAFVPLAMVPVYCATKAAVHSFTMSTRHLFKSKNIEVIELIPPAVDTELGAARRVDPAQSHGGMALPEFINETFKGLAAQEAEIAVGMAAGLKEKGDAAFIGMNNH